MKRTVIFKKTSGLKGGVKMSALLLSVPIVVSLFLASFVFLEHVAQATVPVPAKFLKIAGVDSLTAADWNGLTGDFIDQLGDTMGGDLDMQNSHRVINIQHPPVNNNDAATKRYVDDGIAAATAGSVLDVDGGPMKMVCGRSSAAGWVLDGSTIYKNIDTRSTAGANNFLVTPYYITSIGGDARHDEYAGAVAIYSPSPIGFRVYIYTSAVAVANTNNWYINWCGFGN